MKKYTKKAYNKVKEPVCTWEEYQQKVKKCERIKKNECGNHNTLYQAQ